MAADVHVSTGWEPGVAGWVIGEHARSYARDWDFGQAFEAKVAAEFGAFLGRYAPPGDALFVAKRGGTILGSVTLDAHAGGGPVEGPRLRWFIVAEGTRGLGIGKLLIHAVRAHLAATDATTCWLTTFEGLDRAAVLYARAGFQIAARSEGETWGRRVTEETWVWKRA